MKETINYHLKKPERHEYFNVEHTNENMDSIDKVLAQHEKASNPHNICCETIEAVPITRKVNGKALKADINLNASDVNSVPTSRTVNNKQLSSNISLTASDVGAYSKSETYKRSEVFSKSETYGKTELANSIVYTLNHTKSGTAHNLIGTVPTSGFYTARFKANNGFSNGNTVTINGTSYSALTANMEPLDTDFFKSGATVPIEVDVANSRITFKSGGSGVNKTLPPQIRNFAATSGNGKLILSWQLPSINADYVGLLIVRKIGSAPTGINDGTKIILSNTATSHEDTGLNNDTNYYYRAFSFNSKKQYQTELTGAVVSGMPKASIRVDSLPVGTLIIDLNTKYYNQPIMWKIADKNHSGYLANSVTLISDKIITLKCFDAKEPSNKSDSNRRDYGNSYYKYSNLRQYINSDAVAGNWYTSQHRYDASPTLENLADGRNPYFLQAGFLKNFSIEFKDNLLNTSVILARNNIDGGDFETLTDKIFFASGTEVGLESTTGVTEGTKLSLFNDNTGRITTPTKEAVDNYDGTSSYIASDKPYDWWLRTPRKASYRYQHTVGLKGGIGWGEPFMNKGVRPLCNIKGDTRLSPTPNSDGSYNLL